jgi:hypothetical protein
MKRSQKKAQGEYVAAFHWKDDHAGRRTRKCPQGGLLNLIQRSTCDARLRSFWSGNFRGSAREGRGERSITDSKHLFHRTRGPRKIRQSNSIRDLSLLDGLCHFALVCVQLPPTHDRFPRRPWKYLLKSPPLGASCNCEHCVTVRRAPKCGIFSGARAANVKSCHVIGVTPAASATNADSLPGVEHASDKSALSIE